MREQATVLNDIAEPAPDFHDCVGLDPLAIKLNFARVRANEANNQAQEGGLATTAWTD